MSWWPFGGKATSAASFEKALSQLSNKIKKETTSNDQQRLRQRKYKVLWTIYAVFTYILIAAIFVLVYGWERWGVVEYTVVAGGPPFIFGVRTALDAFFGWRIQSSQGHLNELYKQREVTIEKLKSATKYDSTQQLLDKYGGSPKNKQRQPSPQPKGNGKKKPSSEQNRQSWPQGGRTGLAPPPTANIQTNQPPVPSQGLPSRAPLPTNRRSSRPMSMSGIQEAPSEEFAPNAFDAPRRPPMSTHPSQYATAERKWYDRVLDVMLGEDEGQAKNRIALICDSCKLVNGQAPPGARTLEDIGRWRCGSCHAWNGVESEEKQILKQITRRDEMPESPVTPQSAVAGSRSGLASPVDDDDSGEYEHIKAEEEDRENEDEEDEGEEGIGERELETAPARSTRSKMQARKRV